MGINLASFLGSGVVLVAPNALPGTNGFVPSWNADGTFAGWVDASGGGVDTSANYVWTGDHAFNGGFDIGDTYLVGGGSSLSIQDNLANPLDLSVRRISLDPNNTAVTLRTDEADGSRSVFYVDAGLGGYYGLATTQVESEPGTTLKLVHIDGVESEDNRIIIGETEITLGDNGTTVDPNTAGVGSSGDGVDLGQTGTRWRNLYLSGNVEASGRVLIGSTASLANVVADEVYFRDETETLGINVKAKQFVSDTTGSTGGIVFANGAIWSDAGAGGRIYFYAGGAPQAAFFKSGGLALLASATPYLTLGPTGAIYPSIWGGGSGGPIEFGSDNGIQALNIARSEYRFAEVSGVMYDSDLSQPSGASPTVTIDYQNHSMHRVDLVTNTPSGTPTIQFGSVPRNSLQARGVIVIEQPATALDINWSSGDASGFAWLGAEPTWTDDDGQDRLIEYFYAGNGTIYLRDLGVTS